MSIEYNKIINKADLKGMQKILNDTKKNYEILKLNKFDFKEFVDKYKCNFIEHIEKQLNILNIKLLDIKYIFQNETNTNLYKQSLSNIYNYIEKQYKVIDLDYKINEIVNNNLRLHKISRYRLNENDVIKQVADKDLIYKEQKNKLNLDIVMNKYSDNQENWFISGFYDMNDNLKIIFKHLFSLDIPDLFEHRPNFNKITFGDFEFRLYKNEKFEIKSTKENIQKLVGLFKTENNLEYIYFYK